MPELPFIQVLAENLDRAIRGRAITSVHLRSVSLLKTVDPPIAAVEGRRIERVRRLAKLVIADLDGGLSLVFHLMRNGRMQIGAPQFRGNKDFALGLRLDDGRQVRMVEHGPKKRAAAYLLRSAGMGQYEPLAGLGLDPLDPAFTPGRLTAMLEGDPSQLKRFLTVQRHVTSIGNAYSDEILWEARLSPFVAARTLTPDSIARLHGAIVATLRRVLDEHRARFPDDLPQREPLDLLRVHRHRGEPCPRCGTRIAEVAYAERETYYCPACQTGGKIYADRRLSKLLK